MMNNLLPCAFQVVGPKRWKPFAFLAFVKFLDPKSENIVFFAFSSFWTKKCKNVCVPCVFKFSGQHVQKLLVSLRFQALEPAVTRAPGAGH